MTQKRLGHVGGNDRFLVGDDVNVKQLEAHEVPLRKVFCSDYDFRIPEYQRPYSWGTEQACQLLEDLTEALDRGPDEPYFLGSVVLVKSSDETSADVIDGQQRLTTLTILLAVLRDLTVDPGLARELEVMLQEPGSKVQGLASKPRLTLRDRDSDFFAEFIQNPGQLQALFARKSESLATDAQRSIQVNARALWESLQSRDENSRLGLVQLLGQKTFLVIVTTPDLNSAHRIFSVMNARGLDLSPADIFKSQVVGAMPEGLSKVYADKWEDAEAALGHDDFGDLFLHIRMIFSKERGKRELLKEFPEQVLNAYLPDRATEFVDDIVAPYANAYRQMRDHSYAATQGADLVNAWFRRLDKIENNDWRPVSLWALRHHSDDPVWLDTFLKQLERLASSMLIRRVYNTPRVQRYAEILRELDAGAGLDAPSFALTSKEIEETIQGLEGDVYLYTKGRRYILLRLDEALAKSPGVRYEHRLITVEHVLPQNPAPGSQWLNDFTTNERNEWTHRLANLVLLNQAKNSEAQNFDFDKKKSKYFTGKRGVATFALTSQVLNEPEWTPTAMQDRQKTLLAALRDEWDLG